MVTGRRVWLTEEEVWRANVAFHGFIGLKWERNEDTVPYARLLAKINEGLTSDDLDELRRRYA